MPSPWAEHRAGRGGGRRAAMDGLLHAVPTSDGTRSAVCGARVLPPEGPWDARAPERCPDCLDLLLVSRAARAHGRRAAG